MKKGVSDLLSMVLLVGFAIALAGIVSTIVINKAREFDPGAIVQDSLICDDVNLGFVIDGVVDCITGDGISFFTGISLRNKGGFTIYDYELSSPGMGSQRQPAGKYNNCPTGFAPEELKPNAPPQKYCFPFTDTTDTSSYQFKITPIVRDPEEDVEVICTKKPLIINYKKLCEDLGTDRTDGTDFCGGCSF